jgi:DNA-binding response OmpR family regulator
VSAALPVASGTAAESRPATITICLRELPARRPITFSSRRPACEKRWRSTRKPLSASCPATVSAANLSPSDPGRRSGACRAMRAVSAAARRPSNRTSAARPCGSACGRLPSENIASASASRAGTKAALYTRASITCRPTYNSEGDGFDDELSVQKLLTYPLRKEGYDVVPALDGREALDRLREDSYDLVVLDVMLPRVDGFDVCRQIRSRSTVPIIMLTAKTEELDKVLGLELGADDYITKPFSVREFRSRVKAVLRRAALTQADDGFEEPIHAGDLLIDFERRQVEVRSAPVRLTYVEFEVLAALARNPGRVFSRTMLLERVWGDSSYRDPRTIDVHIRHLREKLEREPKHPELILTVRGVGYRFRDT